MEQEGSGNKSPSEQLEEHKTELKKKAKAKKNVPKDEKCCSKLLARFQVLHDQIEESLWYYEELLDGQRSMSKTISSIATGIKDLNHTLVAHFNSQAQTSVQTNKLMEELADTSLFDTSVSDDNDFAAMTENMSDSLSDFYDSSRRDVEDFSDDLKGASDSIVRVVDNIEDFTDELRAPSGFFGEEDGKLMSASMSDDASFTLEEMSASISEMANDSTLTKGLMTDIHGWLGDIWQNLTNQKNRKVGKTGESLKKKDADPSKGGLGDWLKNMSKWLNPLFLAKWVGGMLWNSIKKSVGFVVGFVVSAVKKMGTKVWKWFTGVLQKSWDNVASFFSKIWKKTKGFGSKLLEGTKGFIGKVWDNIAGFFGKIGGKLGKFFAPLTTKFAKFFAPVTKAIDFIMKPIKAIFGPLMKAGSKFGGPVFKFFGKIAKGFAKHGLKAVPFIGQIWMVVDALWDFTKGFGDSATSDITGKSKEALTIFDKFKSGLSSMISGFLFGLIDTKTVFKWVDSTTSMISDVFNGWMQIIPESWKQVGRSILDSLNGVWEKVRNIAVEAAEYLGPMLSNVWQEIKTFSASALHMLPNAFRSFVDKFSAFIDEAMPKVEGVWSSVKQFGSDLVSKISGFFTSIGEWYDKLNFVDDVVYKIMDFNAMIEDKILGFLKSIFDILPKSVKDFLSTSTTRLSDSIVNTWSALKGKVGLSDSSAKPQNISTAKANLLPQTLNTRTARNMDKERAQQRKEKAPQGGNKTVVVQNNNRGQSSTPIMRTLNTGRSDINRSIGKGAQFSF